MNWSALLTAIKKGDVRKYLPQTRTDPRDWKTGRTLEEIAKLKADGMFVYLIQCRAHRSNEVGMADDGYVLEFRNSDSEASINTAGRFQTGLAGFEAEVKDSRFPDGWAYFTFTAAASAEPMSAADSAPCVECHTKNTAVERTFAQFYPTLLEVARRMGTVKAGF